MNGGIMNIFAKNNEKKKDLPIKQLSFRRAFMGLKPM